MPALQAADLDGVIEPYVVVNVSAPVEGLVEQVAVDRGHLVEQGQVLATLESSLERAEVALARFRSEREAAIQTGRTRIEFGSCRFDRMEKLFKENAFIPLNDLDEAETTKRLAEAGLLEAVENRRLAELELQRASVALALRTIHSPIRGVVVERFRFSGEFANDQTLVLKLAQLDPLRVEVFAPVAMLGEVVGGAQVVPEAPMNQVYVARVTVVDRVADAASGMFVVRLELPNPGYLLPARLKCKVRFLHEQAPRLPMSNSP